MSTPKNLAHLALGVIAVTGWALYLSSLPQHATNRITKSRAESPAVAKDLTVEAKDLRESRAQSEVNTNVSLPDKPPSDWCEREWKIKVDEIDFYVEQSLKYIRDRVPLNPSQMQAIANLLRLHRTRMHLAEEKLDIMASTPISQPQALKEILGRDLSELLERRELEEYDTASEIERNREITYLADALGLDERQTKVLEESYGDAQTATANREVIYLWHTLHLNIDQVDSVRTLIESLWDLSDGLTSKWAEVRSEEHDPENLRKADDEANAGVRMRLILHHRLPALLTPEQQQLFREYESRYPVYSY